MSVGMKVFDIVVYLPLCMTCAITIITTFKQDTQQKALLTVELSSAIGPASSAQLLAENWVQCAPL